MFAAEAAGRALPAAEAVGPQGKVVAVDLAKRLVQLGEAKARAKGLRNIEFKTGDMLALDYPDASFDVVVCVFGIFFVPDMAAAARELWRIVRPGGRLAITTWGPERDVADSLAALLQRLGADAHAAYSGISSDGLRHFWRFGAEALAHLGAEHLFWRVMPSRFVAIFQVRASATERTLAVGENHQDKGRRDRDVLQLEVCDDDQGLKPAQMSRLMRRGEQHPHRATEGDSACLLGPTAVRFGSGVAT